MATIKLKNGSGAPLATDLVQGEPALDLTNKRLYTEDTLGAVIEVGVNPTELNVTGNITVGGTVDGRDVATDGTKLDGVESGATADQTAAEIRTLVESATDSNVFTDADHTKLDGIEASADVTDTANVTAAGALMDSELTDITAVKSLDQGVATTDSPTFAGLTTTADVSFGDNDKVIFGASSDLQIYHTGSPSSNSVIEDAGAGNLLLKSNGNGIQFRDGSDSLVFNVDLDSATTLYHNTSAKLATTSTGIDVTGSVTADDVDLSTKAVIQGATPRIELFESDTTDLNTRIRNTGGELQIQSTDDAGTTSKTRIAIDHATGDISFREDTGSNAKLYWDASAESLGIGTDSPSTELDVAGTVTANSLTVNSGNTNTTSFFQSTDATADIVVADTNTSNVIRTNAGGLFINTGGTASAQGTGATPTAQFATNGDVSLYEDTGTTAKFFWDASAESLGIGTDVPAETLHAAGNIRIGDTGASELYTNTSELRLGVDKNDDNDTSNITFYANDSEKVRMDKDGHLIVPNGVTLGVAVDAYADANTLDDYEEGTFTPELADAASGGNTATTTTSTGVYTKVGNLVILNMRFTDIDTTGLTGTNTLFVRDLPFTNASLAQNQCEGPVRMDLVDVPTGTYSATFATVANNTYGSVRISVDNSNDVQIKVQDINSGSSDIFITVQHFV